MTAAMDVNGSTISVHVSGGEDPPVVLVAAIGTPGASWHDVVGLLATRPRLATYDRPGIGASPPRSAPNPPLPYSGFAAEMAAMLACLGLVDRVVLVGHSFGSLIVRAFAARYPDRVAGMVHVDGSLPRFALWPGSTNFLDGEGPGVTRIDTVVGEAELAGAVWPAVPAIVLARTPGRWQTLPDPAIDQLWQDTQADLARQLDAVLVVARDSGHDMPKEAPALVAAAIDAVVQAVRDHNSVAALAPGRIAIAGGSVVTSGQIDSP